MLYPLFEQKRAEIPPTSLILETWPVTERHTVVDVTFEQVEQKGEYKGW